MKETSTNLEEIQEHVTNAMVRDLGDKEFSVLKNIMVAGLAEEAGEVAGLLKRELRQFGQKDAERTTKEKWVEELGDVLWYLTGVAVMNHITLDEIWDYNTKKLEERYGPMTSEQNVTDKHTVAKDGAIKHYEDGGIREDVPGKGKYQFISTVGLRRLAQRYEYGYRKYGAADNYKKGLPTSECINSAMRHLVNYLEGDNSEDHLAAVAWNVFCVMEMEVKNPKWQDIEVRKGLDCTDYSKGDIK